MSYQMGLNELLSISQIESDSTINVTGLSADSRAIAEGDLFLAYPGTTHDGRSYLQAAQQAGAAAILYEEQDFSLPDEITIPAFAINNLQLQIGNLADHFYRQPSAELQVFGVTGTNGKTTCCYLLTQALSKLGLRAAMIGTIGMGELDKLSSSGYTTPDAISVHRTLAEWRDQGITQVCMEVSSHALYQGRVQGVQFFCNLFTNLSHDHLDFHGDMNAYAAAKRMLFTDFHSELCITNADDELGASLIEIADSEFIVSYSQREDAADVCLEESELTANGIKLAIVANGVELELQSSLVGKVNVPNLLLLVSALLALSTPLHEITRIVAELQAAPGRMESHHIDGGPTVVIDYAHTPDALEKALESVRFHCQGELWCVFGCGGDRDAEKRPKMGAAADRLADRLIVTNDNPRSEDPSLIANQIKQGIKSEVEVVLDRAKAIETAMRNAQAADWVLVAGKGHETTQDIGGQLLPFSDRQVVMQLMQVAA